jgi:ketosteroid isomerase-like protein
VAQFVSPTDLVRSVFAALDAKDPAAVTARMTDDVRMRLGNADFVEGKAKFREATAAFVASTPPSATRSRQCGASTTS